MTEAEWLASTDPTPMLELLQGKVSDRKLRLFGVAACYVCHDPGSLTKPLDVLEAVVGYADGLVVVVEVRKLWGGGYARGVPDDGFLTWPERPTEWVRDFVSSCHDREIGDEDGYPSPDALPPYLRDIFGNPFRIVAFDPAWRTSTAIALARGMYESRDFGAMLILADALQDAGCDSEDVLNHCRDPKQVHVRGCWVVDLVLGK